MEIMDRLRDDACQRTAARIDELRDEYANAVESPIELVFLAALQWLEPSVKVCDTEKEAQRRCSYIEKRFEVYVVPQVPIELVHSWRVDFLFIYQCRDGSQGRFFVECDGHEFHERTKAQISRDKARDREFTRHGLKVFRFAGSDIYRDPIGVVEEVLNFTRQLEAAFLRREARGQEASAEMEARS